MRWPTFGIVAIVTLGFNSRTFATTSGVTIPPSSALPAKSNRGCAICWMVVSQLTSWECTLLVMISTIVGSSCFLDSHIGRSNASGQLGPRILSRLAGWQGLTLRGYPPWWVLQNQGAGQFGEAYSKLVCDHSPH